MEANVWPSHLPNSSIKTDDVRVFLSGRDRPYRQDFHAATKLFIQNRSSPRSFRNAAARSHRFSLEQLADGTGAAFRVRGGPFQGHDLLTERQLDSYGDIGGRLERYECRQSCRRPLSAKPHCAYLFANRRANRLKVLVHDFVGIWLAAPQLNQGSFHWPGIRHGCNVELDNEQLQALVLGLPWQSVGAGGVVTVQ